jgi:type I protein arginine methyltransferase
VSLVLDEHREYLSDGNRLAAYERAISQAIRPGDAVLDLASGTGILGLFACRAGARCVYAVDSGGIIELAREVAASSGFGDRIVFVRGFSKHVTLPERVDVVVSDQIGRFGFEAGVWEYYEDARRRFVKPGARMLPERVDLFVVPVTEESLYRQICFWETSPAGFDFSTARRWATNTGYPATLKRESILGEAACVASLPVASADAGPAGGEVCVRIDRDATLHGIGGWFVACLYGDVTLTNSPLSSEAIGRRNVFLPVERPISVNRGDLVRVGIRMLPREVVLAWRIRVERRGHVIADYRHSTWEGMLVTREELARTRPGYAPALTDRGRARRTVLELCNGQRLLSDIEQEVYRQYGDLFRSSGEAAVFVAEVVTRYGV